MNPEKVGQHFPIADAGLVVVEVPGVFVNPVVSRAYARRPRLAASKRRAATIWRSAPRPAGEGGTGPEPSGSLGSASGLED